MTGAGGEHRIIIDRNMTKDDARWLLAYVWAIPKRATWEVDKDWGLYQNRGMHTVKAHSNAKYNTIRLWFKKAGANINSYTAEDGNHWIEFYRVTTEHTAPAGDAGGDG